MRSRDESSVLAKRAIFIVKPLAWCLYVVGGLLPVSYVLGIQASELASISRRLLSYGHDSLVTFALLIAAFGLGGLLLRVLHPCPGELNPLYAVTIGLGMLSLSILGLGVIGAFYVPFVLIPIAVGTVLALSLPANREIIRSFVASVAIIWSDLRGDGLALAALVFSVGSDVYALMTNAMVPPLDWDTVAYHLAVPAIYVKSHGIVSIPYIVYSNWPFNLEMLYVPSVMLGTERTAGFLTVAFFALGQLGLVVGGARYFSPRAGALSAAFYTGIPYVLSSVGTARVDVPLATWAFLAILAFYDGLTRKNSRTFALSGMLGGFAAGSKLTAASTLLILGIILVGYCLVKRPPGLARLCAAFVVPAVLVASPWYAKSWILTGDPIWPFLYQIFPTRGWDAYGDMIFGTWLHSFGTGTSLESFVTLPKHLFLDGTFDTPTGPLFLGLVPVALVSRKTRVFSWFLGTFTLASVVIWFFLTQQSRFLSPALLTLSLLAGWGTCCLLRSGPAVGKALFTVALVAWFVVQFPLVTSRAKLDDALPFIRGAQSRDVFLQHHVDVWPVFEIANTNLPSNARILLLYYEVRGFYLQRSYIWGNPVSQRLIRWEQIPDAAALDRELSSLGVTYVILTPKWYLPNAPYAQHMRALIANYLRTYTEPISSANGDTLYRIVRPARDGTIK